MDKFKEQIRQRLKKLKTRQVKKIGTSRIVCKGKIKGYKFIIKWADKLEYSKVIDRLEKHIGLMEQLQNNCNCLKDWAAGKRAAYKEARQLLEGLKAKTA